MRKYQRKCIDHQSLANPVLDTLGDATCQMHFLFGPYSVHREIHLKIFKKKNYRMRAVPREDETGSRDKILNEGGKNESSRRHPCLLGSIHSFRHIVIIISTRVTTIEMEKSKLRNNMKRNQHDFSSHRRRRS